MNPDDVKPKIDPTYTPPSDPSAYMRTYAKDVAMLTKTPPPIPNDIFNSSNKPPAPVPMMPQVSIGEAPSEVVPAELARVTSTITEETNQERESILARLRAKLATHAPMPVPAAEPVVPVVSRPVPIAVPQFVRSIEPPVAPLPIREPIVQIPERPATQTTSSSPIHTFSSDFSDRIDSERASTFSVLASQSDAKARTIAEPKKKSPLIPIVAGVVLLLCGIGAVAGAYLYKTKNTTVPVVAGVPSLLTFDESVEVKGSGTALMQAIADVAAQASVAGNVIVTYVTVPGSTGGIPQPGGALIKQLPLTAPDILMRNIDDSSTVGTIHAGTESRPFLVLRVNSYERSFAGMLAWEPTMAESLALFFPAYTDVSTVPIAPVATTSTSTPALPQPFSIASPFFSDAVVANHDVRILRDARGRSLILYGYHGKDTLIIARDEAAFTALIARLSATATP